MDNKEPKKLGCSMKTLLCILVFLVICFAIYKYGAPDNQEIPDDGSLHTTKMAAPPMETKNLHMEDSYTEIPTLTEETFDSELPVYESQTNYSSKLPFYTLQLEYAAEHEILLERAMQEESNLSKWLSEFQGKMYYLEPIQTWDDVQFKRTRQPGDYLYFGDLNDNRPDGYGILILRSELDYGTIYYEERYYNFLYIGEFIDGQYDGFGLQFYTPDMDLTSLYNLCQTQPGSDEFTKYYYMWYNYVQYFGEFAQGYPTGKGNYFSPSMLDSSNPNCDINDIRYSFVQTGSFKNGLLDGYGRDYWNGLLQYEGDLKEGLRHGYGKSYYYFTDILEYEGEFKDDQRHGHGTSYTDQGEVDYSGEWWYGDYA